MYRLQTLGLLRLTGPAGELLAGRRRELSLLAYLRCTRAACTRGELADLLWGDRQAERARHSLRQALLELRRATGELVEVAGEEVRLRIEEIQVDVEEFEAHLRGGAVEAALAIWGGDFLSPLEDGGSEALRVWLEGERARLRRLLRSGLEEWTAVSAVGGRAGSAVERAQRWVALFPEDADAEHRLVEALHAEGRTEEALARHAAFAARQAAWGDELPASWSDLQRRLEREHGERLRSRPHVGSTALFVPDLAGRAAVMAELRAAWDHVRAGGFELVRIAGEEGSGKTRLLDEVVRSVLAETDDLLVLRARAFRGGGDDARSTIRELLAPLHAAPGLGGASSTALAELGVLVPGVTERFRSLPAPTGDPRLLEEAALEALHRVAEEVRLAVLVDDLPLADSESFRLFGALARRPPAAGVLLAFTAGTGGVAAARVEEIQALPVTRRFDLGPLSVDDLDTMLASMLPLSPEPRHALAAALHAETGGNPLYVYELTAALAEESHLLPDGAGGWDVALPLGGPLPLPTGIREVVARRLARLSGGARELLGAAAVLGERFEVGRLEELVPLPPAELSDALDELLTRRVVREVPNRPGTYLFAHALTRRVAYDRVLPARRQQLLRATEGAPRPWYRALWQAPEAVFIDAGAEGEWLTARVRLVAVLLFFFLPVANLVQAPREPAYRAGLAVSLVSAGVALAVYLTLRRGGYRPWLGFLSVFSDVSLVSLALLSFALVGSPHAAVNSKPVFDTYFLAILGSSLRYDKRICIFAGLVATAEYLGILAYVTSRWRLNDPEFAPFGYGMFDWTSQVGRLILFGVASILSWEIVRRAQELRRQATRDLGTGLWSRRLFDARAEVELSRARRFGYDVAVALLEVAGHARLVDAAGRRAGDDLLQGLAGVLRSALREEDLLARFSGDAVAVLLPGVDLPTATQKLQAVRPELEAMVGAASPGPRGIGLALRIGLAGFPGDGLEPEALLREAEARARREPSGAAAP